MGGSGVWIPLQGKIGGFERNKVGVQTVEVDLKVVEVSSARFTCAEDSTVETCTRFARTGASVKRGSLCMACSLF